MKKLLFLAILLTGLVTVTLANPAPPGAIGERVLKAFKETFKYARDISWHEYQDYYQVNFKQDEVQLRAQYSDDGTLLKMTRYYKEDHLLPTIVAKLKRKYPGKQIFGVTEVSTSEDISFVINLRDADHWYVVKSDVYGSLQQKDKFKRADK